MRVAGATHATDPLVLVHGGPGGKARATERSVGALLAAEYALAHPERAGQLVLYARRSPERCTLRLFTASAHLPDEEEPDAYVAAILDSLHTDGSPH